MLTPGPTLKPRLISGNGGEGNTDKNKGALSPFVFLKLFLKLLVIDVHRNFETKTNIAIFRCLPFHVCILR